MHLEDKKVFSQELGFPVDFTSKQAHEWHFALKGTWSVRCCGRDQKPLGGVGLSSLLTFPLLWHVTTVGFGSLKPKIGSVFHHGRLSCKITDEQGLSKQAAGGSSLDLYGESRNELGQASEGS